jgi:phospho-N-acetylmuramoyl-pentapeptide-transferase
MSLPGIVKNGTPTMEESYLGQYHPAFLTRAIHILDCFVDTATASSVLDTQKLRDKKGIGIRARYKFPIQVAIGLVVSFILFNAIDHDSRLIFPFFKKVVPDLGGWYILFGMFVIVGSANAVNLTDGLDGLAIGPVLIASGTFMLFCYLAGNFKFASYLQIPFVKGSGELTIVCELSLVLV